MNLHHLEIFRCVFETSSMTAAAEQLTIKHLVADNVGIAILSRLAVTHELNSGKLIELHVRGLQVIRPLHLARVPGRAKTLAAEAFIELLSRHWPQNEEFTI